MIGAFQRGAIGLFVRFRLLRFFTPEEIAKPPAHAGDCVFLVLAARSLRTSTRPRSEHDLPPG